jgi:hypothetical protein
MRSRIDIWMASASALFAGPPIERARAIGEKQMLTLEKLKVYRQFGGDIDGWARWSAHDSSGMTDGDWSLIDELVQALHLIRAGQAAPEFAASVEQRLLSITPDEPTREMLRRLSEQGQRLTR